MIELMLVIVVATLFDPADLSRSKKIISGYTSTWTAPYSGRIYLATVATLHLEGSGNVLFARVSRIWKTGVVECSGAFITPNVVQTACRCVAIWTANKDKKAVPAKLDSHWERIMKIYVGVDREFGKESMAAATPLKSKKFVLHQGCSILPLGTFNTHTSDYGWIVVDPDAWHPEKFVTDHFTSYAPQYTLDEMTKIWRYFQPRRPVCLHQGLGRYCRHCRQEEVLRHGWITLEPYHTCAEVTGYKLPSRDHLTWVCSLQFKYKQTLAQGDVGGPFTCNNFYFGVAAGWRDDFHLGNKLDPIYDHRTINFDSPIVFAVYENAADYRAAFIRFIDELGNTRICDIICRMTLDPDRVVSTFGPLRYSVLHSLRP